MKARPKKPVKMQASEVGTFIQTILENLLRCILMSGFQQPAKKRDGFNRMIPDN